MLNLIITSKKTGKVVKGQYSLMELFQSDEESIIYELTQCDCQPIGETNVVECNCEDEWEDYEVDIVMDNDRLGYIHYLVNEDIEYYESEIKDGSMKDKDSNLDLLYRGKLDALKEIKYFIEQKYEFEKEVN